MAEIKRKGGFFNCVLKNLENVSYVSSSFCSLLGYDVKTDFLSKTHGDLKEIIHPKDLDYFYEEVEKLIEKEQIRSFDIRFRKKNGEYVDVVNVFLSMKNSDGEMLGFAVAYELFDSERLKINNTEHYGMIICSNEKDHKIIETNNYMLEMLGYSAKEKEQVVGENLRNIVSLENKQEVTKDLINIENKLDAKFVAHTLTGKDGSNILLPGLMFFNRDNNTINLVYVSVEIGDNKIEEKSSNTYFSALSHTYDLIFKIDAVKNTLHFVHAKEGSPLNIMEGLTTKIDATMSYWIDNLVIEEDRKKVWDFVIGAQKHYFNSGKRISFRMNVSNSIKYYSAIMESLDDELILFCFYDITEVVKAREFERKNKLLVKMYNFLNEHFQKQPSMLVTFKLEDNNFKLVYVSKKLEPYITENGTIEELSSKGCDFIKLLRTFDFTYNDFETGLRNGEIQLFLKNKEGIKKLFNIIIVKVDGEENTYCSVIREVEKPKESDSLERVYIKTFGYFDIFVDGKPIVFKGEKTKELLALLVDRQGGLISNREAVVCLWEEDGLSESEQSKFRKVFARLVETLDEYGVADIVDNYKGQKRIVPEKIQCDYYMYLQNPNDEKYKFRGSYMNNYSWAERTLAELEYDGKEE